MPRTGLTAALMLILFIAGGAWALSNAAPPLPPLRFALTDQAGQSVSEKNYLGRPALIFFGYTQCPSICPPALMHLSEAMDELGARGIQVRTLFITVDPAHDTPAVLTEFLAPFNKNITGLTGASPQLQPVYDAFKAYAGRDHTGFIYLADAKGRILDHFTVPDDTQTLTRRIALTLQGDRP